MLLFHANFHPNTHFLDIYSLFRVIHKDSTVLHESFMKHLDSSPKRTGKSDAKHPSSTSSLCFIEELDIFFEWLLANTRGRSPTVEAGARSTYGHRASREYKGQTPIITN